MIKIAMYTTIITLYKKAVSQRQIAKLTKIDRKTVSKIIKLYEEKGIDQPVLYQRESILNAWHQAIVNLLEKSLTCRRIYEQLKD